MTCIIVTVCKVPVNSSVTLELGGWDLCMERWQRLADCCYLHIWVYCILMYRPELIYMMFTEMIFQWPVVRTHGMGWVCSLNSACTGYCDSLSLIVVVKTKALDVATCSWWLLDTSIKQVDGFFFQKQIAPLQWPKKKKKMLSCSLLSSLYFFFEAFSFPFLQGVAAWFHRLLLFPLQEKAV